MLETLKEIIVFFIPIFFMIIGFMIYKKPKEVVQLIKSEQELCEIKENKLKKIIESLKQERERTESRNKILKKMLDLQNNQSQALLSTISGSYPRVWRTLKSWQMIYDQIVKDGLERGVIRGDVFVGRSGYQSSEEEAGRLVRCGLIDYNKIADEVRILHMGHIVGQSLASLDTLERVAMHK